MWVKKFLARTLSEAMAQVKAELGPDAVILHTNQVKVGGIFGLFGTRMVEVTAAADQPDTRSTVVRPEPVSAPLRSLGGPPGSIMLEERIQQRADPQPPAASPPSTPPPVAAAAAAEPAEPGGLSAVKSEMVSMKAMLGMVLDRMATPGSTPLDPDAQELLNLLVSGGIQEEMALELLTQVKPANPRGKLRPSEVREFFRQAISATLSEVRTADLNGGGRRVIALVGPTGVGKTTTLAKLAAHFALGRRLQIALVTADTYRIAAVEQLRTYSDILGVPLEVVYDPVELGPALERHRNRDLILVDTAGRSPRNPEHMQELKSYLDVIRPDETYLVVSLTSSYRDAAGIVDSYLPVGIQRFIFTKWDEAEAPGLIYNMVHKYRLPISYITNGQNVPDDIEVASPEKITRAILGD